MNELHDMSPSELVHQMLINFNPHAVSRDRDGDPDEHDTLYSQNSDYTSAADQLDTLLTRGS